MDHDKTAGSKEEISRIALARVLLDEVGHDLRQELNIVNLNLACARDFLGRPQSDVAAAQENLQTAEAEIMRTAQMLEQLGARCDRYTVSSCAFSIADVARQALTQRQAELDFHGVKLEQDTPQSEPYALGDPGFLRCVLDHLLDNAIAALRQVPISARKLRIKQFTQDASQVLELTDSACNLPEEVKEAPFSAFVHARPGHLGLGLTTCARLMATQRGRIWLESDGAPGTRFCLSLPVAP